MPRQTINFVVPALLFKSSLLQYADNLEIITSLQYCSHFLYAPSCAITKSKTFPITSEVACSQINYVVNFVSLQYQSKSIGREQTKTGKAISIGESKIGRYEG